MTTRRSYHHQRDLLHKSMDCLQSDTDSILALLLSLCKRQLSPPFEKTQFLSFALSDLGGRLINEPRPWRTKKRHRPKEQKIGMSQVKFMVRSAFCHDFSGKECPSSLLSMWTVGRLNIMKRQPPLGSTELGLMSIRY